MHNETEWYHYPLYLIYMRTEDERFNTSCSSTLSKYDQPIVWNVVQSRTLINVNTFYKSDTLL